MSSRLEALKNLLAQNPADIFTRYALAMEYANSGDLDAAIAQYRGILEVNPGYGAAYYHGGQALEKLGRLDDAREMYQQGIVATTKSNDQHTRSELQAALDILG